AGYNVAPWARVGSVGEHTRVIHVGQGSATGFLPREAGEEDRHTSRVYPTCAIIDAELGISRVRWRWRGPTRRAFRRFRLLRSTGSPPPCFAWSPSPASCRAVRGSCEVNRKVAGACPA